MENLLWALIIILKPEPSMTSIEGFSSKAACEAAFAEFVVEYRKEFRGIKPRGYCIPVE